MLYLYDQNGKYILTMDDARGVTIGRSENNLLVLVDEYVSSKHAAIYFQNGKYFLCDLNSKNGTFIGTQKITNIELRDGVGFSCGNVLLQVRIGNAAPVARESAGKPASSRPDPPQKKSGSASVIATAIIAVLVLSALAFLLFRSQRSGHHESQYQTTEQTDRQALEKNDGTSSQYPARKVQNSFSSGNLPQRAGNRPRVVYSGIADVPREDSDTGSGNLAQDAYNFGKGTIDMVREGYNIQKDPSGAARRMMEDESYAEDLDNKVNDYTENAEKLSDDIYRAAKKANNMVKKLFGD